MTARRDWAASNLSRFAAAAVALTPPNVSLSLPRSQHVVKSKAVLATVSCTRRLPDRRRRRDQVGGSEPLRSSSRVAALSAAGKLTATIPLTAKELSQIQSGLSHHRLGAHHRSRA